MSYLTAAGFDAVNVFEDDMATFKAQYLIPDYLSSCHTAIIEDSGYFVEGHIPLVVIDKILEEMPDIDGIALAGMPPMSPGMELMGGSPEALEIYALKDGTAHLLVRLNPGSPE